MANRTYLLGLNSNLITDDKLDSGVLVEASYLIPLLWFSLFRAEDQLVYENTPLLLTTRENALRNLDARIEPLVRYLGEPCRPILDSWRSFIHEHEWKNYLVNTMELVMLQNQEGEFQAQLAGYMAELEQIDAGTTERELSIVTQASDSLSDYPYQGKTVFLCGASFDHITPWDEVVSGATA